jgi:hypothetical protein
LNLQAGTGAVCFASEESKALNEPLDTGCAQKVIRVSE